MSEISSIKVNGTIYTIKDNIARSAAGLEFPIVIGQQTTTTGTWIGNAPFDQLVNGQKILYFLPFAGSNDATLNLTLSDGETTTGAKNVYISGTTRMKTHYDAGNFIPLIYRVDLKWGTSTTKYTGWWAFSDRTTDTANNIQVGNLKITAGTNGIYGTTLVMRTENNTYESIVTSSTQATTKTKNTSGFYLDEIFYYSSTTNITSGNKTSTYTLFKQFHAVDFRYNCNSGSTLIAYVPIYLVGTISNGLFYLDDTWWTQTLPTCQDNKVYIYLGEAYNTTSICLSTNHPILHFVNGNMEPYTNFNNFIANYMHRDVGKTRSNDTTHSQTEVLWGTDYNDLIDTGLYSIRGNSDFPTTNAPPGFANNNNLMYVLCMQYASNCIKQIAISARESNNIYMRTKNNNGWQPWASIITATGTNNETGTFTLTAVSSCHTIEHLSGQYQLVNDHFVYINASFKITTTTNNENLRIKLSGLPFTRNTSISGNTVINVRPDKDNTSALYAMDACIADSNYIYIYCRANDGTTQYNVPAAENDKFYISGMYAI